MSQQDANLKQGVSPWQDAWRRLKKNKMAMFGLWAVAGMSLISIFGPMLPGVPDPNVQFNFVGAQPAMSRHVYVQNKNSLALGQAPRPSVIEARGDARRDCRRRCDRRLGRGSSGPGRSRCCGPHSQGPRRHLQSRH